MTERMDLLASITNTIRDYRSGEIPEPTPDHVDRWISQFDENVQLPMLCELDHVFKFTYISRDKTLQLLRQIAKNFSCDFWREAHILNIQRNGKSQFEIRKLFHQILREQCGNNINYRGSARDDFVYLDDAIFTGKHVIDDLSHWLLQNQAVENVTLYLMFVAIHQLGKFWIESEPNLEHLTTERQISINFQIFFDEFVFENRLSYRNQSDVLWPIAQVYSDGSFQTRQARYRVSRLFTSEQGRQLLERTFLDAGRKIQNFANEPNPMLKPLGFSAFTPGFGSLLVTYRNCPNNCPLALWYGDPTFPSYHPFSKWYPLFPRKTYDQQE